MTPRAIWKLNNKSLSANFTHQTLPFLSASQRQNKRRWRHQLSGKSHSVLEALPDPTFSILHFWSQIEVSSHGWYIPSVTQLIRMTVMVALSNQLEGEMRNWSRRVSSLDTHGLRRILIQSLLTGWSRGKYLKETWVNCGALMSISIPGNKQIIQSNKVFGVSPSCFLWRWTLFLTYPTRISLLIRTFTIGIVLSGRVLADCHISNSGVKRFSFVISSLSYSNILTNPKLPIFAILCEGIKLDLVLV